MCDDKAATEECKVWADFIFYKIQSLWGTGRCQMIFNVNTYNIKYADCGALP